MKVYAWLIDLIHRRKNCPTGMIPGGSQKVTEHRETIHNHFQGFQGFVRGLFVCLFSSRYFLVLRTIIIHHWRINFVVLPFNVFNFTWWFSISYDTQYVVRSKTISQVNLRSTTLCYFPMTSGFFALLNQSIKQSIDQWVNLIKRRRDIVVLSGDVVCTGRRKQWSAYVSIQNCHACRNTNGLEHSVLLRHIFRRPTHHATMSWRWRHDCSKGNR